MLRFIDDVIVNTLPRNNTNGCVMMRAYNFCFSAFLYIGTLTGCTSYPFTDTKAYPVRETKEVETIQGCTNSACSTTFKDKTSAFVSIPVMIGDKITFVWSAVANRWFSYNNRSVNQSK